MEKVGQARNLVLAALAALLLALVGLAVSAPLHQAYADTSVKIVSFADGRSTDLRSSELLMAQVDGYDGDISQLTFTWENTSLGTYLYAYGSSDMTKCWNTDLEQEIEKPSTDWWGRVTRHSYTGKGFAWAAVYGANLDRNALNGTITVTVKNGNTVIGTATYTNFKAANLQSDLHKTAIGIFEGETQDAKALLGQGGIVHITCSACTLTVGRPADTKVATISNGTVRGVKEGSTTAKITVDKGNCKFHQESEGTFTAPIHVFHKPDTSTTTTTLTLSADSVRAYEYSIDGQNWVKGTPGQELVFEGLTPDTLYEVSIRAPYKDPEGAAMYAYARVEDRTKKVVTVSFDAQKDGVTNPADQVIPSGEKAFEPEPAPEAEGYTFDGWYTDKAGTKAYNFDTAVTKDITLYGKWTAAKYTVTFDLNGHGDGAAPAAQEKKYGQKADKPADASDAHYNFTGWYTDKAGTKAYDFDTAVTKDITIYAGWTAKNYTVKFDLDGGTPAKDDQTVKYNEHATDPGDPTKTGYEFDGWYTIGEQLAQWQFDKDTVTEDMTLKAHWTPADNTVYKVEHYTQDLDADTYTLYTTTEDKGVTDEEVEAQPIEVAGFTLNLDAPDTVKSGTILPDGSLVLKLYYDRNTYELSYKYDTVTLDEPPALPETKSYQYGETVTLAEDPVMEHYEFSGWTVSDADAATISEDEGSARTFEMPANDVVAHGSWTARIYTVTWLDEDEETVLGVDELAYGSMPFYEGETPTKPEDNVYTYAFAGWTPEVVEVTGDATYVATYEATEKPTEDDDDPGKDPNDPGKDPEKPEKPSKPGTDPNGNQGNGSGADNGGQGTATIPATGDNAGIVFLLGALTLLSAAVSVVARRAARGSIL